LFDKSGNPVFKKNGKKQEKNNHLLLNLFLNLLILLFIYMSTGEDESAVVSSRPEELSA